MTGINTKYNYASDLCLFNIIVCKNNNVIFDFHIVIIIFVKYSVINLRYKALTHKSA